MTLESPHSLGQWQSLQKTHPEEALGRLHNLVSSLDPSDPAWISRATNEQVSAQFRAALQEHQSSPLPLFAVPFAVKDNIDVSSFNTTAACPDYSYLPEDDAHVVKCLKLAGAIVVGKTNLDQFATGLVGTRSPYGVTPCVFSDRHVSGGSSTGSASVVARGIVPFSLGTDTAGSGRVPAMLNNIIGVKPSRGILSCYGVVPACKSLDCVSIFTADISSAKSILDIAVDYDSRDPYARPFPGDHVLQTFPSRPLIASVKNPHFFDDKENEKLYQDAVNSLRTKGAQVEEMDFGVLFKLAACLYEGPWVAERYSAIREFINMPNAETKMDPTVYKIIKGAEKFTAADAFHCEYIRLNLLREVKEIFGRFDALVVPTAPGNPTIQEVQNEPILINSRQGTYTNFVNLADMSALAIPSGWRSDRLPFGITLISSTFNDYALLKLGEKFLSNNVAERLVGNGLFQGKSRDSIALQSPLLRTPSSISVAVVGAHLTGMPLNFQLSYANGMLRATTTTSEKYRLYALLRSFPPKPGLRRIDDGTGKAISVEVYDIPSDPFGSFVSQVPHPLAIGTIELADGSWVKGFVCEQIGYDFVVVEDITSLGGWRNYCASIGALNSSSLTNRHAKENAGSLFRTVLIANRGEIAVRIIKTLKKLGIESVAVHSEIDEYSQHVLMADKSVTLSGSSAAETYLNTKKILQAAKSTGAQAIIPGYGFLSENADFADACVKEGLVFVGPSGDVIRALGLKHSAREIAKLASVPLVPGSDGLLKSLNHALSTASEIGYPLMIKSSAGGGGIGIQRVDNDKELERAYHSVQRLAMSYFSNSSIFMERFIDNARHVEVQIMGDGKGGAVSLGERDCSVQRRNQKIIEETPAPGVPRETRKKMRIAAENLVSSVKYGCAGTVEYIYDESRNEFYFLEVNTRLQVEHPITEMCTGIDLVEWMLTIASGVPPTLFNKPINTTGVSMEARVYAENPLKDFKPSAGKLTQIQFPETSSTCRIDTWVSKGAEISSEYDPTIAKIIVHGIDRTSCLTQLRDSLNATSISGVITNLDYLRSIADSSVFENATMSTRSLDSHIYKPNYIEVAFPGSHTSVQDYPGRKLLWHIGVPPSGPMDDYAFRAANRIVGNASSVPAIECTLTGPSLLFHVDSVVAITGNATNASLEGVTNSIGLWKAIVIKAGQKLTIGKLSSGCRAYVAVRGGIDVPEYLGSGSTFTLGQFGGFNGRVLKVGDVLKIGEPLLKTCKLPNPLSPPIFSELPRSLFPVYPDIHTTWKIGVTVGPHGAPDFFTAQDMGEFFSSEWKVHYNSNRFGVRLIGPKPKWARTNGGEGGLHPSNTHDYVYAAGAINFTGDEPVILTCDGPSLGGFVCPAVVVEAEKWKLGQLKPGNKISFVPLRQNHAIEIKKSIDSCIEKMDASESLDRILSTACEKSQGNVTLADPVLLKQSSGKSNLPIVYRQSGDRYILMEYGENTMDINISYLIHRFIEEAEKNRVKGIVEMSRGVRSLLVEYETTGDQETTPSEILHELQKINQNVSNVDENWSVPSRIFRLPMAFEDKKTLDAVDRYKQTIRSKAPWLPNNVDFMKKINELDSRDAVKDILYSARFIVLGLGDVFLGAPCAVPLDPRHRLLGTKYDPSRSFTPNGTVGIGGMYMCIYTCESPGGYQLVGRTVPIWDKLGISPHTTNINNGNPWLLSTFDQIEFYPVSETELDALTAEVEHGRYNIEVQQDCLFDHGNYKRWLHANHNSIEEFRERHQKKGAAGFAELIKASDEEFANEKQNGGLDDGKVQQKFPESAHLVYAEVAGRLWKTLCREGDTIAEGDALIVVEAMKTEMTVNSTAAGTLLKLLCNNGDFVDAGSLVAVVNP